MWYGWPQCLLQRRALSDSLHCLRRCNSDGSAGWRFGVSELVVRRRSQKTRFWEAWIATATNLHHVVVFVLSRRWCVTFLFFAVEGDCVLFFYCQMFRWSVFESVVKGQRYNKAKNSLGNCAKTGSQNGWLTTWCTSVVVKLGSTDSWDQHSFPHWAIHLGSWYACLKISLTTLFCLQPFSGRNSPLTSVSPKRRSGPKFIKIQHFLSRKNGLCAEENGMHCVPSRLHILSCSAPEHYFDVEVKTRGLLGIKMTWEWEGMVSKRELINVKLWSYFFS